LSTLAQKFSQKLLDASRTLPKCTQNAPKYFQNLPKAIRNAPYSLNPEKHCKKQSWGRWRTCVMLLENTKNNGEGQYNHGIHLGPTGPLTHHGFDGVQFEFQWIDEFNSIKSK
jgi:hypothetical protein